MLGELILCLQFATDFYGKYIDMTNSMKKNWLILAHCFNMDGRAASQTITDKIPFIMKNGISPIVVSAPTGTRDKKFVHHQVLSPAPSGINFEMRKIIEKEFGKGIVSKFLKAIITFLCFPFLVLEKLIINLDSHWSWFITAGIKSCFLIRKYKPQLIYSTAGPSSTHLTGYILKKIFSIPWLAEIHDPLIHETGEKRYQRYAFHKWLEKKVFQNADAVIYFTENACRKARQRTQIHYNSHVLRPGATPPKIGSIRYKKKDQLHFGHFGSLASDRNLVLFMEALSDLFEEDPSLKKKIKIDVYGTELDAISKKAVKSLSLEDVVCEYGRLELDPVTDKSGRQQVFEKMHQCDVLLLIHGNESICDDYIPSKLYEYLLTQRPILGIASKQSELGSILSNLGHSIVEADQFYEIKSIIKKYTSNWEKSIMTSVQSNNGFTVEKSVEKIIKIAGSIPAGLRHL